jgi:hypothetical protein
MGGQKEKEKKEKGKCDKNINNTDGTSEHVEDVDQPSYLFALIM